MKQYFIRRISLLHSCSMFFLGFGLAVGNVIIGIICLVLGVILDVLGGLLSREKR